jgi:hypothetical protein
LYAFLLSSIKVTHSEAEISFWSLLRFVIATDQRFLSTEEVEECNRCITVLADGPTVPLAHCLQHVFIASILRQLWGHGDCSRWCWAKHSGATCEQTRAGCVTLDTPSHATHHECLRLRDSDLTSYTVNC